MSRRGNGAKRDERETEEMGFADKDSFIAMDGRVFLSGSDWDGRKEQLFKRDNGRCRVSGCRGPAEHPHHIKHRSKGGDDSMENLMCICANCHRIAHKEKSLRWSKS